jgi:LacI family transcriptional regulator
MSTRATIADVAVAAGVSRAAVSKVLRNAHGVSAEMRARVDLAVEQLGYRPRLAARAMRGSTNTIGVVVNHLANHFFAEVLEGAMSENDLAGYQLIVAPTEPTRSDGHESIEALYDREVDGIVVVAPLVDVEWLERMARRVPVVVIGRHDSSEFYDTVVGDDLAGAEEAVRHLIASGHRRIAHLTHFDPHVVTDADSPHRLRREAYERVMRETGLTSNISIIVGRYEEEPAYRATLRYLSENDTPTAVFAGNDDAALGVMRALDDAGVAVGEVAIVGYDNSRVAANPRVSLSSVDQRGNEMGRIAFQLLRERIDGRTESVHHTVPTQLIVRGSSFAADARTEGLS